MSERLVLHEYAASGNCYKIRLTAAHVGIVLERREYDILAGETRTPAFLASVSAAGRIPVLQVGDRMLPESNAACCYLAEGSPLIPPERFERADMLRWMFFEQYHHEPNIATLRFWRSHAGDSGLSAAQQAQVAAKQANGEAALRLMDAHLADRRFLIGERLSLADLILYPYSHVAEEGGFPLTAYPGVRRWLVDVAAARGHVAML